MAGTQAGGKEGGARCGLLSGHAGCGCRGRSLYCASSVGQGKETTFSSVSLCLNHLAKGDASLPSFQGSKCKNQDQPKTSRAGGKGKEGCIYLSHILSQVFHIHCQVQFL